MADVLRRAFVVRLTVVALLTAFSSLLCASARSDTSFDLQLGSRAWWGPGSRMFRSDKGDEGVCLTDGFLARDKIAVTGGVRYRLSLSILTENAQDKSAFVQVSFRGKNVDPGWRGPISLDTGSVLEPVIVADGGTHTKRPQSIVIQAPDGADQIVIYVRRKHLAQGIACFSALELAQTAEPVTDVTALDTRRLAADVMAPPVGPKEANQKLEALLTSLRKLVVKNQIVLASHGRSSMDIYVAPAPDIVTLNAAAELGKYLHDITGADFLPIKNDASPGSRSAIVVGRDSRLAKAMIADAEYEDLKADGFIIRSSGPHLIIAGATPRGTLFGVFWFLDHKLGVRWLAPDVTYMPKLDTIVLDKTDEKHIPRFDYREVLTFEGQDKVWRIHNLMNGESHGPSFTPTPPAYDIWDHSWNAKDTVANFFDLLPPSLNAERHPDWYAGGQLAMMNAEMRKAMADVVIARLRRLSDYRSVWFSVHDMDWGWDMDPASRDFAAQHGNAPAAPRLDMMIDVAKRVRQVLPNAKLAFNAYHWSFDAPSGIKIPPYLMVYPMTIGVNYRTSLNGDANTALGKQIELWSEQSNRMLIWDHVANFNEYIMPDPNITPMAKSIKWLSSLPSVKGYFAEGIWDTPGSEFVNLRDWLIARLTWDPSLDIDSLLEDFTDHFYGPAGSDVLHYINLEEDKVKSTTDNLSEKTTVDLKMFDLDFLQKADKILEMAEVKVKGTIFAARVRAVHASVDFVLLANKEKYRIEMERLGNNRSKDNYFLDFEARRLRFWSAVNELHLQRVSQGSDLDALHSIIEVKRTASNVPDFLRSVKASDRFEIQDTSLILFGPSRLIADNKASDGVAVRVPGTDAGWNLQMKFDRFPVDGEWQLFAGIRSTGPADAKTDVFRLGSHPPMQCNATLDGQMSKAGQYQFFEVPGGPFKYSTDHEKSIYFQMIPNSSEALLVDRLIAVRNSVKILRAEGETAKISNGCHVH